MTSSTRSTEVKMHQVVFRAMGSEIHAAVESDDPAAEAGLAQLPAWFEEWEQCLSRFRETSELSGLNRATGDIVPVSETLWTVLQIALETARDTGGLVTPTVLNAVEAAGYNRSFDKMNGQESAPAPVANGGGRPATGWQRIELFPGVCSVRLPRGTRLDFGGIAKGWAADEAARGLSVYGPAMVNAGGDIAVSGPRVSKGEPDWPIGIDWPSGLGGAVDEPMALVMLRSGGVATSGRDYRKWQQGGRLQHHIIDPRTGLPSTTDVLAATIVGPGACAAETAAKVAMLLGSVEGMEWLEAQPSLAGLLVLEDGTVLYSTRMRGYLWSNNQE